MTRLLIASLLFAGCGPLDVPTLDDGARPVVVLDRIQSLQASLDALPTCGPEAHPQPLTIVPSWCTLKRCTAACCNSCSYTLQQGGVTTQAPDLHLSSWVRDCELPLWQNMLAQYSFDLAAGCVGAP